MGRRASVVLITFNSAPYLPRCLSGIQKQTHSELELIVVDNASSDKSFDLMSRHASRAIRNEENRGFAAAANQGIAASTGDFVLLINPDVFLEADYIAVLIRALENQDDRWGSATGKLLRGRGPAIEPSGEIDSKGIRMTRSGRHFDIGNGEAESNLTEEPTEVFGVSAAAALYRREFLEDVRIGGEIFDEDFFAYREDADLAWRGRLFGWRGLYVPAAVAYHVRRVTPEVRKSLPPEINRHSVKNRFLLRMKNEGGYLALRNAPFELIRDLAVIAATLTVERSSLPALRWLWTNRARIAEKRKAIQARRRVSDRELASWFR
jgi:GT2 family glycosyltransferase